MKLKRIVCVAIALLMLAGLFAGCGDKAVNETGQQQPPKSETQTQKQSEEKKETQEKKEPVHMTVFTDAATADSDKTTLIVEEYKKMTGNTVEHIVVPGQAAEIYQKIDISLMSGEKVDMILCNENYFNKVTRSELGYRLNELIDKDPDFDADKVHGKYLQKDKDGGIYGLPFRVTLWAVFYNKKIFDDAGVPYPKGPWTWDEYIETAKKLNNPEKGIYGSYMPVYENMFHIKACMAGISAYKDDETSNFDHPVFSEGLEFYKNLSAVHNIQPDWTTQKLKKMGSFHFLGGSNGMMFISSWYLEPITDLEKYPRDWKIGIAQIPTFPDVEKNNNFGNTDFIVINRNSENVEAAYDYVKYYAQNMYKYFNAFPAIENVPKSDIEDMFRKVEEGTNGEITVEELYDVYINNGLGFYREKLGGIIANEYNDILGQEAELYLSGEISLDEAIKNIKERADQAIQKALAEQ